MRLLAAVLMFLPACLLAKEVDVELFLAVDVSRSMSPAELEIQRRGYAEAITSTQVIEAIQSGMLGRIAVTYVEWAGSGSQRVVVPWTEVASAEDAAIVARGITNRFETGMRRTSISSALSYATAAFDDNGFTGLRRVIDVSGDGPNNQGGGVIAARDAALARGIIINGLPLMTQDALSEMWGIPDLDAYYRHCVIGGPGAFVIPVLEWSQFADAVKRKLVLEIAQAAPTPQLVQYAPPAAYDCLVGEKMWDRNRTYFDIP
ncbi:DUF1194 domain-containing protein [uncultured Roseobacter sp.]|uniref:DUF1194 domain-containing protein n=1 Tax=uncultured Roseobacter sp. TaxID=114847 RepID=UPI00262EB358|nr:DUF1194 domain-containing protein [uncultured Roseobacter sp.]